jgi:hypothetical protein
VSDWNAIVLQLSRDVFDDVISSLMFTITFYLAVRGIWFLWDKFKPEPTVLAEIVQIQIRQPDMNGLVVFWVKSKFQFEGQDYFSAVQGEYDVRNPDKHDKKIYQWLNFHENSKTVVINFNRKNPSENYIKELERKFFLHPVELLLLVQLRFIFTIPFFIGLFLIQNVPNAVFGETVEIEVSRKMTEGYFSIDVTTGGCSENANARNRCNIRNLYGEVVSDREKDKLLPVKMLERTRTNSVYHISIDGRLVGDIKLSITRNRKVICEKAFTFRPPDEMARIKFDCG